MITAYFDGSITKNPGGSATYGALVKVDGRIIYTEHGVVGEGPEQSVNTSEYGGLIAILRFLGRKYKTRDAGSVIHGDSQLVIRQMTGEYKAHQSKLYYPYYLEAKALRDQLQNLTFVWIPREQNVDADALSKPR